MKKWRRTINIRIQGLEIGISDMPLCGAAVWVHLSRQNGLCFLSRGVGVRKHLLNQYFGKKD